MDKGEQHRLHDIILTKLNLAGDVLGRVMVLNLKEVSSSVVVKSGGTV